MNRTAINNYAVWARREMVAKVSQRALKYGITEENHGSTTEDSVNGVLLSRIELKERNALIEEIEKKGYKEVMDEVAYTWFNRFIALRFMEVNGYLPTMIRVFTDDNNNFRPQILTEAINLEMDGLNIEKVYDFKKKNDNEGLFKYLIITQCNALSTPLPQMFQKINDYTELLFPDYLLRDGSVIQKMIEMIPEDDWKEQVQIIGWLYQYYISEKKDEVFKAFKEKNLKATAKEIPAATQLFTPDWIVRYLIDNSLGRLWMLNHPQSNLSEHMAYYIKPCDIENDFIKLKSPEEIKFCDPCCGSGHMLTYAFDILFNIYSECGYTTKDAVEHIIKDNLYGIELDNRAGQLAYFALMMKAREKYRRFFSSNIQPNICVLHNVSFADDEKLEATSLFNKKNDMLLTNLLSQYEHADTLGSLITPIIDDIDSLKLMLKADSTGDLFSNPNDSIYRRVQDVLKFSEYLSKRYHVVVTNPPYMGNSNMGESLKKYLETEYKDYKYDMFSAFFVRCCKMAVPEGYLGFMSPYVWMFISSYEALRRFFIRKKSLLSLIQLEYSAFEDAAVALCTFVFKNTKEKRDSDFIKLTNFHGGMKIQELKAKEAISNTTCNYLYKIPVEQFNIIPSATFSYWINYDIFKNTNTLSSFFESAGRCKTHNNDKYVLKWWEIYNHERWVSYANGGKYRRWYGSKDEVVDWAPESVSFYASHGGLYNPRFLRRRGISWNLITSATNGFSIKETYQHFSSGSPTIMLRTGDCEDYWLAFLNSAVATYYIDAFNPTVNTPVGDILSLPAILNIDNQSSVSLFVKQNIEISKSDWDSFETSWDFKRSPLLKPLKEPSDEELAEMDDVTFAVMGYLGSDKVEEVFYSDRDIKDVCPLQFAYEKYRDQANEDFYHLKMNEEELNRIFIDIYGLQDELKPEEEEKMVSIHRIYNSESEIPYEEKEDEDGKKKKVRMAYAMTKKDVVKNFISYAVGCMFGRYSLDVEGLAYAGGEWDESKYSSFIPDKDNIIPITEKDYFDDDILTRFIEFVKVCYGETSLEENLSFIADSLEGKGTPRDVIRSYFINDFYKDHLKMYQKRPIYWLFDSGKKNGFKALIYMHRYQRDTIARVRTDYVHEIQNRYRAGIEEIEKRIGDASSTSEKVKLEKKESLLNAQAEEVRVYEEKIHHLADQMIPIDLDDGVKVNYAKFKDVLAQIK